MSDSDSSDDKSSPASAPPSPPPSVASSSRPTTPKSSDSQAFKSSLQVLLKKQDDELVKNLEFRKKLEVDDVEGNEEEVTQEKEKEEKREPIEEGEGAGDNDGNDDNEGRSKEADSVKKVKKLRKKSIDKNADGVEVEEEEEGDKKKEKEQRRRKQSKGTEKGEEGEGKEEEGEVKKKGKAREKKMKIDVDKAGGETTKVPKKKGFAVKTRKKSKTNLAEGDTRDPEREEENGTSPKKENETTTTLNTENETTTTPKKENETTTTPKKETGKTTTTAEENKSEPRKEEEKKKKKKKMEEPKEKEELTKKTREPERDKAEAKPKQITTENKGDGKVTNEETKTQDESNRKQDKPDRSEDRVLEPKTGKGTDNHTNEKENAKQDVPPTSTDSASSPSSPASSSSLEGKGGKMKEKKRKKEILEIDYERTMRNQQGILMKKGMTPFSSWKKYYFVLDGKLLMYYHSESNYRGLLGAKGSLDLATLEKVAPKKAGRTKSHFPFALCRRNKKTINLATATEDERDSWVTALNRVHQNQNQFSGSENVLNASPMAVSCEKKEKSATLPVGTPPADCCSEDSSSESEDESPKGEKKLQEQGKSEEVKQPTEEGAEPKEEEPWFIKPKKVMRIGIGIPLDLGAVKLKKVDLPKKEAEKAEPKPSDEQDKDKDENSAEIFGVRLKKTSVTENAHQRELESKIAGQNTVDKEPAEVAVKRPGKQPIIPLNKSPLLSHAELDLNRVSPESKRSKMTERKKSPSPSIPLSRGLQAVLVKSGEEPDDPDGGKTNELSVNVAVSKEIRYSDEVMSMQDAPSIEYVPVDTESDDRLGKDRDESAEVSGTEEHKGIVEIPQVSVEVIEKSDQDLENEETDEEFLRIVEQNRQSGLLDKSSNKTYSKDESLVPKPSSPSETLEETLSSAIQEQEKDVISEKNMKNAAESPISSSKSNAVSSAEVESSAGKDIVTTPLTPIRLRSGTNESSVSSCKSDSENTDKKSRKVKKSNSKNSTSGDDEKQEESNKESKTKRKKKSSFSKLLPSKKNKEKKGKHNEDSLPPDNKTPESHDSPKSSKAKQIKPEENIRSESPVVTEQVETAEKDIPHISVQENLADKDTTPVVELRHNPLLSVVEGRCSTYSRSSNTSREMDPPPIVPEKRGIRAKSPCYDIPQSNRPITSAEQEDLLETEPQEGEKVDGMISQEQINAILIARDSREKRKMSLARNSGGLLIVPDSSQASSSKYESPEDMSSRRPSYYSIASTESDEPLPRTHFLSSDRHSSGSGSFKNQPKSDDSDISDCPSKSPENSVDLESSVVLRRQPRLTDTLIAGKRVSLTSPEFTVLEEDRQETSDARKNSLVRETSPAKTEVRKTSHLEDDEQDDYFPVIGGRGAEVRQPSPSVPSQELSVGGMRTSGILGLKAFLEENQEDLGSAKAGISRLGHSAAIEKLKRESGENT